LRGISSDRFKVGRTLFVCFTSGRLRLGKLHHGSV
jgi:hypothetical protein